MFSFMPRSRGKGEIIKDGFAKVEFFIRIAYRPKLKMRKLEKFVNVTGKFHAI